VRATLERHRPDRLGTIETEANHLSFALEELGDYDVLRDNSSAFWPLLVTQLGLPALHTVHGGLTDDAPAVYRRVHDRVGLVALSRSQRADGPELRFADVIPNPIDIAAAPFSQWKGDLVALVGRMAPEKAPHLAIEASLRAETRLVLAGPVHDPNRDYFDRLLAPRIDGTRVVYVGSLAENIKNELLAEASALLCPTSWSEPFGLVAVEAMSCGPPVIAFPRGALMETVVHGESGLLVRGTDEMTDAIRSVRRMDPHRCRQLAAERFSVERVAARYEAALARAAAAGRVVLARPA
jgi:glycosyltransferase involved in cell wall biosynthesis